MSIRDENQSNFGCTRLAVRRHRRTCSVPLRKTTETQTHTANLVKSIQKIQCEFNSKWNSEHARNGTVDKRQFQWNFWLDKVLELQDENEKVFVFMNERSDEYSPDTIEMCRKKILYFYKMADLYRNSIYGEIQRQERNKIELTIMIGVESIQKYRCSKFLRLWKIISWEHQRTIAKTNGSSTYRLNDTESLIMRNVREFLNVVYDLS